MEEQEVELTKLSASTLDELAKLITDTIDVSLTYRLSVTMPLTQASFVNLAESHLGRNIAEIDIETEYLNRKEPQIIDTSLVKFPKLKSFTIKHQSIQSIHFTSDCFPLLESLTIDQPCGPEQSSFHTDLPHCYYMNLQFIWIQDTSDFGPSLNRSPKLDYFWGYKLRGLGGKAHKLVLPNITVLDLDHCDDLGSLKIWAPKLEKLELQHCYAIRNIHLFDLPPHGFSGPVYDFKGEPSRFMVNCISTDMPCGNLFESARCKRIFYPDDDPDEALCYNGSDTDSTVSFDFSNSSKKGKNVDPRVGNDVDSEWWKRVLTWA